MGILKSQTSSRRSLGQIYKGNTALRAVDGVCRDLRSTHSLSYHPGKAPALPLVSLVLHFLQVYEEEHNPCIFLAECRQSLRESWPGCRTWASTGPALSSHRLCYPTHLAPHAWLQGEGFQKKPNCNSFYPTAAVTVQHHFNLLSGTIITLLFKRQMYRGS